MGDEGGALMSAILSAIADHVYVFDAEGRFTFMSKAPFFPGATRESMMGKTWREIGMPPAAMEVFDEVRERVMRTGAAITAEMDYPSAAGTLRLLYTITALDHDRGERSAVITTRDITQAHHDAEAVKDLTARLEAQIEELREVNGELEAFSYSVSHDLRAPLRAIDGFSRALVDDYGETLDAIAKGYLTKVLAAASRMGHLIDDLLGLARITRTALSLGSVDVGAICSQIVSDLRGANPRREIDFVVPEELLVHADARLLRVALENLLGNAVKFTGKKARARIEVGACVSDSGARAVFVRDDGAGFDPKYAAKLFGAFQRLHTVDDFPGTGIGLATVQRVIHRHRGRIWAEATPGEGATFYFTLGENADETGAGGRSNLVTARS
jgi:PAS domain S-box-containing protein